mmetsp:Transcript_16817/g.65717  ORF Transcript_16817/g.65717 Transcript_16817/m.65717 type:complete len:222 (-) Transcript_16817:164-829(-)
MREITWSTCCLTRSAPITPSQFSLFNTSMRTPKKAITASSSGGSSSVLITEQLECSMRFSAASASFFAATHISPSQMECDTLARSALHRAWITSSSWPPTSEQEADLALSPLNLSSSFARFWRYFALSASVCTIQRSWSSTNFSRNSSTTVSAFEVSRALFFERTLCAASALLLLNPGNTRPVVPARRMAVVKECCVLVWARAVAGGAFFLGVGRVEARKA